MTTKTVSHAKKALPPKAISEVYLVPIERIQIKEQVRTEFNEDSIKELAADIETRGLRQPIEITPIGDEKYKLTLGERRLRAIQLLGHKAVPAIIVKTNDKDRLADQLAENIQREDLSLKDLAKAVRKLFDQLQSLQAVADLVKKSKPWVSKHLALSYDTFGMRARQLLESGKCEDIELLNILSQIEKVEHNSAWEVKGQIESGKMNRDQAREFLKNLKEKIKKSQKDYEAKETKRRATEDKKRLERQTAEAELYEKQTKGTGEDFIQYTCYSIDDLLLSHYKDDDAARFIDRLSHAQREALQLHLEQIAKINADPTQAFNFWRKQLQPNGYRNHNNPDFEPLSYFEQMAIVIGMTKQKPDIYALVKLLESGK